MKSLKFVLPCAAVLFAAAPATATPRFACASLNDAYSLAGMANDYQTARKRAQLRADGRCFNVPAGRMIVDHKIADRGNAISGHGGGAYACIRPRGKAACVWTF